MAIEITILLMLIMVNAFFAASEMAFVSLNDAKIEKLAKEGNKKAKLIFKMLKAPSKFLATIQIGITFAGFLSSAFASSSFAEVLAPQLYKLIPQLSLIVWQNISIVIITIILSFFTLIFGELVPKRLAMKHYEKISMKSIGIINTIQIITSPFVKLLTVTTNAVSKIFGVNETDEETITEEEIKMMVDQGQEKGTIKADEKELINNVFELNDILVSEIMKHRKDICAININTSIDELIKELSDEGYTFSRIPVYEENIDNIKGIIYVKDILKNMSNKELSVRSLLKEIYFISENKLINEAFKELQKNKKQMAIVVDEYGGTAGIITMEDILEELVGEIFDEYDIVENEYEVIDENTYLIAGNMTIYDVNKLMNIKIPEGEYDTISGFVLEKLGRIPNEAEKPVVETEYAIFKIEEYTERRIIKIKACKNNVVVDEKE